MPRKPKAVHTHVITIGPCEIEVVARGNPFEWNAEERAKFEVVCQTFDDLQKAHGEPKKAPLAPVRREGIDG